MITHLASFLFTSHRCLLDALRWFTYLFKLNLLGWHWLIRLYSFQVHFYDTWSVHCIVCPPPKVKSSSVTLYLTPTHFPSGHHHSVVCVYDSLFVLLLCSFVAFSFISHMSEIIWFLTFSSLLSLSMVFSRPSNIF